MNYMIHNHPLLCHHDDLLLERIKTFGHGMRLSMLQANAMWISHAYLKQEVVTDICSLISHLQPYSSLAFCQGHLTTLPSGFSTLSLVTELNLSQNNFLAIPPAIASLVNLKKLTLIQNGILAIPDFLSKLTGNDRFPPFSNYIRSGWAIARGKQNQHIWIVSWITEPYHVEPKVESFVCHPGRLHEVGQNIFPQYR